MSAFYTSGHIILPWHCCAVHFNVFFVFHKFIIFVHVKVFVWTGELGHKSETSSAITAIVKPADWENVT